MTNTTRRPGGLSRSISAVQRKHNLTTLWGTNMDRDRQAWKPCPAARSPAKRIARPGPCVQDSGPGARSLPRQRGMPFRRRLLRAGWVWNWFSMESMWPAIPAAEFCVCSALSGHSLLLQVKRNGVPGKIKGRLLSPWRYVPEMKCQSSPSSRKTQEKRVSQTNSKTLTRRERNEKHRPAICTAKLITSGVPPCRTCGLETFYYLNKLSEKEKSQFFDSHGVP